MADNKKFLDITGLTYFYDKLKGVFAPKTLEGYQTSTVTNENLLVKTADTPTAAIGKLEKAIIDNEQVFTNATESIAYSVGLNESLGFTPSADSSYASAKSIVEAIDIISVAMNSSISTMNSNISTLRSRITSLEQQVADIEPSIPGIAQGTGSKSLMFNSSTTNSGANSIVTGSNCTNTQSYAFVGGNNCTNSNTNTTYPNFIFGYTNRVTVTSTSSGSGNAIFGRNNTAQGSAKDNFIAGSSNTSNRSNMFIAGDSNTTATTYGEYSAVFGRGNLCDGDYSLIVGKYCNTTRSNVIIAGYGTSSTSKKNVFRVSNNGQVYGVGAFNTSGADYAEMLEWEDGNPDSEDRVGYFVTLVGDKIKIAKSTDMIIGVVSGTANVIGNNPEDWHGREKRDDFGRRIFEEKIDEATGKSELIPVDSEEYDSSKEYIPRENRKEWSAVGLIGQLRVRQDGTLSVGDKCTCNDRGIATKTSKTTKAWYVMKVISPEIVQILFK